MLSFVVGPSRQAVSLHSGIFQSFTVPWVKALDTSHDNTTGNSIVIEEAVEDIFGYVCQYLYVGDYFIPLPDDVVPYHIVEEQQYKQDDILTLKGNIFENSASIKKLADYIVRDINHSPHFHQTATTNTTFGTTAEHCLPMLS